MPKDIIRKKRAALPNVPPAHWKSVEDFAAAYDKLPPNVRAAMAGNQGVARLNKLTIR